MDRYPSLGDLLGELPSYRDVEAGIRDSVASLVGYNEPSKYPLGDTDRDGVVDVDGLVPFRAKFRERFPEYSEISDADLQAHLEAEYRNAVGRYAGMLPDNPKLPALADSFQPHWLNPIQKYATMAVASRDSGNELRELFPGEYPEGSIEYDQVDDIIPPRQLQPIEAHKRMEYWRMLNDPSHHLEYDDVHTGMSDPSPLMRGGKYNNFGGQKGFFSEDANWVGEGDQSEPGVLYPDAGKIGRDGPKNYFASKSSIAPEVMMNSDAPATTAVSAIFSPLVLGAQHAASEYATDPEKQLSATGLPRAIGAGIKRGFENVGDFLGYDYMTEVPTMDIDPISPAGYPNSSAGAEAIRRIRELQRMQGDSLPAQGQEGLMVLGVPKETNTPVLGIGYDATVDMFGDHNGLDTASSFVTGRGLGPNLTNEAIFNTAAVAGNEEYFRDIIPRGDHPDANRSNADLAKHGGSTEDYEIVGQDRREAGLAGMRKPDRIPDTFSREFVGRMGDATQRLAAKNPWFNSDMVRKLRKEYEESTSAPTLLGGVSP